MAEFKVDDIHYHYSKTTGKLEVWCFNNEKAYAEKYRERVAKYDFGRKPYDEEGNPTDKKEKLLIGLYRQPYMDGWKYTISEKVHPHMIDLLFDYILYGWKQNENGEIVPTTYLRHNRKVLGIHYLLLRYCECYNEVQEWNKQHPQSPMDYKTAFLDFSREPYFPTPDNYDGYIHSRSK